MILANGISFAASYSFEIATFSTVEIPQFLKSLPIIVMYNTTSVVMHNCIGNTENSIMNNKNIKIYLYDQ